MYIVFVQPFKPLTPEIFSLIVYNLFNRHNVWADDICEHLVTRFSISNPVKQLSVHKIKKLVDQCKNH